MKTIRLNLNVADLQNQSTPIRNTNSVFSSKTLDTRITNYRILNMPSFEETIKLSNKIKKGFWKTDRISSPNKNLKNYYEKNVDTWCNNAKELRNDYPKETNLLLANIYKSTFSFKLITERFTIIKQSTFSIHEKIRILKESFENSYQYFALITICINYSKPYVKSLSKDWYNPSIAKETIKKKSLKPWKNENGEIISGKKWILLNCQLLKFSSTNIDILQALKNADSHEKLVITKEEVIILIGNKTRRLAIAELNLLFKYVRYCMTLAIHFNSLLAIKHNFWITPALIIANPNKFSFEQNKLPDFFPKTSFEKKPPTKKRKQKTNIKKPKQEYYLALGINIFTFLFEEMWEDVLSNEPIINKFLGKYNLIFNSQKFVEFQTQAKFELLSCLTFINNEIKSQILEQESIEPHFEITIENTNEFNYFSLLEDLCKTLLKVKGADLQKKTYTMILMLIGIGAGIFTPLQKIHESLNQVIVTKEKFT